MDFLEQWQSKLDTEFPRGLLATWDVEPGSPQWGVSYQIPRAEVITQAGLDPVIGLPVFGIDKMITLRVLSYDVLKESPLVVRVTSDDPPAMLWSADVSEALAGSMALQRKEFTDWYAQFGRSIFA